MPRRRNRHPGITETAWRYLNDLPIERNPGEFDEVDMLESGQFDYETGYRTRDIWAQFRGQILANWIRRYPGTRPWCWWRFDSGLVRVSRVRDGGIIEDTRPVPVRLWLVGRTQDNAQMMAETEREALREQFILDQRAWLAARGLLEPGE